MELIDSLFLKKSQISWTLIFLVMTWGSIAECKAQSKNVKSVFNKSLSSPDLTSLPVKKIQSLQEVQDLEKLKSDFYSINEKSKELKKLLSDSTFYAQHKDSINAVVKSHLEDQQQLIQEQASILSDGIEQNIGINQDDLIPSNLNEIHTAYDYKALNEKLDVADLDFQQQMKEMLPEVFQMEQLEGLSARISDVDYGNYESYLTEVTELESKLMEDGKTSVLSKINRKAGFEQIAYKEVVVKSGTSSKSSAEMSNWKIGFLYNLAEGISYSSLVQGYLGIGVVQNSYLLLGGSMRMESNNASEVRSGYGVNIGFRHELPMGWFAQATYERNKVNFKGRTPYGDLNFAGMVHDGALGIGKVITLNQLLNSVFTGTWSPFYDQSSSLQGTRFSIRIGIEFSW
ncbi:hypothetical protein MM239_19185 [Belliella sp. DSM 111904]|uniref:Outer membrane protein beta-barrel domain-containing protein n=1 Tax=Belliella filtrata TaxID=2923435 RepID=A0ABS9V6E6_9BACT|nr:hypothetical protein [Belliella filtrata]MCH7411520.1 hypothetical protein [Belliella filtrata]